MTVSSINLYDYFHVAKPQGARGNLVCYIQDNSKEVNINRKQPVMLVIPGGGYIMTSFREKEPVCLKFLSYGFTCFMLDYSIYPVQHPYYLLEAVMAMDYIRKNAEIFHIDPNMIAAVGFSAGGHLCGMLGTYEKRDDIYSLFKHSDNVRPNAIILSYPVITATKPTHDGTFEALTNDEQLRKELSIENLVNKNSAPAFIWATQEDNAVPVRNSLIIAKAYCDAGVKFALHIFNKGIHGASTGDMCVYGDRQIVDSESPSLRSWCDLSIEWLSELGIYLK